MFNSNHNYKKKYNIDYSNTIGGSASQEIKYILLDGTSSAGKSSICDDYNKKGYVCLKGDNVYNNKEFWKLKSNEYNKLPNEYMDEEQNKIFYLNTDGNFMLKEAIKNEKAIIDWISCESIIESFNQNKIKLFTILVYTGIPFLARNMIARKKDDYRRKFVFKQYANRYTKSNDASKTIDSVNREKFKEILLANFKMEFKDEKELIDFCNDIFQKMNITDDNDHGIMIKENIKYDYLLITNDKSKEDIIMELDKIII